MKIGFLFPGQGSQTVGMGKDLYENYEIVREIYDKAEEITKIPIKKLSFEGPEEELNKTQNTQLAILTMSLAITKLLETEGIKSDISAGLSLGEYSALINSKAITIEDGLNIVKARGKYMQELCPKGDWKMAAIMGLTEEQVNEGISKVKSGFVKAVNFNTEGQIVLSGETKAIEEGRQDPPISEVLSTTNFLSKYNVDGSNITDKKGEVIESKFLSRERKEQKL